MKDNDLEKRIAEWSDIPEEYRQVAFGFPQFVDDLIATMDELENERDKYLKALWQCYEECVHEPAIDPFNSICKAIDMVGK